MLEVIKVTPRGYCKGVTRAIALAKQTALENPGVPIHVLGMLVHNTYVVEALRQMNIFPIDDKKKTRWELLDDIEEGIVIFTAHGIAPDVKKKAEAKGLRYVDASCPDVVKTQQIVEAALKQGNEILYIGKKMHPEAEAVLNMSPHIHLITCKEDVENLPDFDPIFVTNQTTMSIFDIENLFSHIKERYPMAVFCEEICNATRIRQQAVADLKGKHIDVLYVVGDSHSNNSNRLAEIGKEAGIPFVYLIDDIQGIEALQLADMHKIAVTSGASTPTYLTSQVIAYLEAYETDKEKPAIDMSKII